MMIKIDKTKLEKAAKELGLEAEVLLVSIGTESAWNERMLNLYTGGVGYAVAVTSGKRNYYLNPKPLLKFVMHDVVYSNPFANRVICGGKNDGVLSDLLVEEDYEEFLVTMLSVVKRG